MKGEHRVSTSGTVAVLSLVAALLVAAAAAQGAATTPDCLAKKLGAWGKLRRCQAIENGRVLRGKPADPAKCQRQLDDKLASLSAQAAASAIACRFAANGDGTVTDYDTGLQWEQKANLDGAPNPADLHDADNAYSWSSPLGLPTEATPDGTAFTIFLGRLNACHYDGTTPTDGFAGHCDWRLPSIIELAGLVDLGAPGCSDSTGPCIDQTAFGPSESFYWSATPGWHLCGFCPGFSALGVYFSFGAVYAVGNYNDGHVRVVRSCL